MTLSIRIDGRTAKIMRGPNQVGALELGEELQVQEVKISRTASPADTEQIIRLASSHVAQYMPAPRTARTGTATVLKSTQKFSSLPGSTPEKSRELLDFSRIPQQHARLSVEELRAVLRSVGVRITTI